MSSSVDFKSSLVVGVVKSFDEMCIYSDLVTAQGRHDMLVMGVILLKTLSVDFVGEGKFEKMFINIS